MPTSRPETRTTPAGLDAAAAETIPMFVIITVQKLTGGNGYALVTVPATVNVRPGTAHEQVFRYVCETLVPEQLRGGNVLFYAIHPAVIT
jgi:hypothetical protein